MGRAVLGAGLILMERDVVHGTHAKIALVGMDITLLADVDLADGTARTGTPSEMWVALKGLETFVMAEPGTWSMTSLRDSTGQTSEYGRHSHVLL